MIIIVMIIIAVTPFRLLRLLYAQHQDWVLADEPSVDDDLGGGGYLAEEIKPVLLSMVPETEALDNELDSGLRFWSAARGRWRLHVFQVVCHGRFWPIFDTVRSGAGVRCPQKWLYS